jgi:hypothetical protein
MMTICVACTTGQPLFAECQLLCRVQKKHSANRLFAECQKKHSANKLFAECFFTLGNEPVCRVFFLHSANKNYKAYFKALNDFKLKSVQLQSCITSQNL